LQTKPVKDRETWQSIEDDNFRDESKIQWKDQTACQGKKEQVEVSEGKDKGE